MTVDIHFGKYELRTEGADSWDACDWPDEPFEDDGTHPDFSIFAGKPRRSFSNVGFADWIDRSPIAYAIAAVCYHDDQQATRLDDGIMRLIEALPNEGTPIDKDRARWFKYWARRARETFRSDAVIYFW